MMKAIGGSRSRESGGVRGLTLYPYRVGRFPAANFPPDKMASLPAAAVGRASCMPCAAVLTRDGDGEKSRTKANENNFGPLRSLPRGGGLRRRALRGTASRHRVPRSGDPADRRAEGPRPLRPMERKVRRGEIHRPRLRPL